MIKPLLDGVISSFHAHDGSDAMEVSTRVARTLDVSQAQVERWLNDPESAVLGRRRLLWRWRNGVQWNPADDLCVAAEVVIDPGIESEAWSHSGEIFEALARPRP